MTRKTRRSILKSAGEAQANIQIQIIPGIALAPRTVGESYHYETPAGNRCWYPNAYRRAFGRPVYIASTRRVIVGQDWIGNPVRDAIMARFGVAEA